MREVSLISPHVISTDVFCTKWCRYSPGLYYAFGFYFKKSIKRCNGTLQNAVPHCYTFRRLRDQKYNSTETHRYLKPLWKTNDQENYSLHIHISVYTRVKACVCVCALIYVLHADCTFSFSCFCVACVSYTWEKKKERKKDREKCVSVFFPVTLLFFNAF